MVHSADMDGAMGSLNNKKEVKEMLAEIKNKLEKAVRRTAVLKEGWGLKRRFLLKK